MHQFTEQDIDTLRTIYLFVADKSTEEIARDVELGDRYIAQVNQATSRDYEYLARIGKRLMFLAVMYAVVHNDRRMFDSMHRGIEILTERMANADHLSEMRSEI